MSLLASVAVLLPIPTYLLSVAALPHSPELDYPALAIAETRTVGLPFPFAGTCSKHHRAPCAPETWTG